MITIDDNVPENIAKMCKEKGASCSHVIATEWIAEGKKNEID